MAHDDSCASGGVDLSRRGFLKGAGALAAAPLAAPGALVAVSLDDGIRSAGPGAVACDLMINGKKHNLQVEPRVTLLEALRDKLDMTGAKEVCARGACGACTVFVEGMPVNSCMMLAVDAAGAKITTVEGLAQGDKLDPVQEAFCRHDALQCGYCTPGFVMSIKSLLTVNPKPTMDDVRKACSGNICRCGTYTKVFEAAMSAAGMQVPVGNETDNKGLCMEATAGRVDGALKVTGRAKYTADVNLPNMAYASILCCPYGKARLKSSNVEAAQRIKGVVEVSINTKRKEFKYCGQQVGYVCADTRQALDDAVAALALKWEILEPATDPIAEHQKHHGPLPPSMDNAGGDDDREAVAAAFKSGKAVEATYHTQIQTHSCLEPHCAVADYRGETAEMWVSSQANVAIFRGAMDAFELEGNKVKTHCEFVGGGFGSKFGIDAEGALAAQLSKKLKRPVKVVNDRKREQLDTGCRPGSIQYMKFATNADGTPSAGFVHVAGVCGAQGGGGAPNPSRYDFGRVIRSYTDVNLTVGDARAMRAPGHPQAMFAVDSFVDELAKAAGVDPLKYRKKIESSDVRKDMYDLGAERIGWATRPTPDGSGKGRVRRGMGMGVGDWGNGQGRGVEISIEVHKDGTLRVLSGTQDIGQGNRTVLADTVAYHLGIDRKIIFADCGNSAYPPGPGSGGSTTARTIVPAIRDAAQKARNELKKLAEVKDKIEGTAAWVAACKRIPGEKFSVLGRPQDKYWGTGGSECVQFAEVEVDTGTGVVQVKRVIAIQNCGIAVNRLTAESQICGGVIQGVSYALFEDKILDPRTGAMVNPNLEMYKILGSMDCPEIVPILWKGKGNDPGVRSLGEPPVVPTAGAVANAIANAIGVRVRSMPITPARVLAALNA